MSDEVRKSGFPEPAGELLHKLLRRRGVLEHVQGGRAVAAWAEAVGPAVAEDTMAVSFRAGELSVWAREATQAHTLQRMSPKLLEALELALGGKVVRRLRFLTGARPEPPDDVWRAGRHTDPDELTPDELASVVLSDEDRAEIDTLVGGIENPEVRGWVRASAEQHVRADRLRMERGWRPCVSCGTLTSPEEPDSLCATCRLQGYGPPADSEERNGVTERASEPSEPNGGK